jgi:para-aminobenzoate synthetase component 1
MAETHDLSIRALPYAPPEAVAAQLAGEPGFVWLDSAALGGRFARWSFQAVRPARMLTVTRRGAFLDSAAQSGPIADVMRSLFAPRLARPREDRPPPLLGGWIGYLSYELAEHLMAWRSPHLLGDDHVLAELGDYGAVIAFDHGARTCTLVTRAGEGGAAASALAAAHEAALAPGSDAAASSWSAADLRWSALQERADVVAAIARVKAYVAAGDIYQANLAQAFVTRLPAGARAFEHYLMLRRANPSPFAAFLDFPARAIGSTSPERFLAVSSEGQAEARPIKGTIRCGATPAEDREAVRALSTSEKDRAENVMIVDLLRNDLSRVCRPHTVKTPEVCTVETYEGLHHLTSSVTGTLKPELHALDAVLAAFPGGSITGAPKLRAMEIIAELEPERRGVFCGAIGYVGVDGTADFNIAIRTVEYDRADGERHARLLAGGGITYLSDPEAEYEESLLKAERVIRGRAV